MAELDADDYVVLGRFNSPFGVQGWIKVYSYTDPMENILSYRPWLVKRQGAWEPVKVKSAKKTRERLSREIRLSRFARGSSTLL
jgi:16S rRNA processing protein RimM